LIDLGVLEIEFFWLFGFQAFDFLSDFKGVMGLINSGARP